MDFLPPAIEEYINRHTSHESELLRSLNRETYLKVLQPRMLSGHLQGRVLSMLAKMIMPTNILEIGTYTGYSALCLAEGLLDGGRLDTIDRNEELEPIVKKYINEAGKEKTIYLHIGTALEIIESLNYKYDIIFIDADKENYVNYYKATFDKVPVGGYIIADNVLWSGKVLDKAVIKNDYDTKMLVEYNKMIMNDERVENVLFPVRDGLMIARKLLE